MIKNWAKAMANRRPFEALGVTSALLLCLVPVAAWSDTVRLHVGDKLARIQLLKAGTHRYLRYVIKADGSRAAADIWSRTLSFPLKDRMRIEQRWDRAGSPDHLDQSSEFEASNFTPLTHIRRRTSGATTSVLGYRYEPNRVTGMSDLADSTDKDFLMTLPEPSYNFEYDMELLQTLPLASGRTFEIPFYDAGIDKAALVYAFAVARSDRIPGWDGRPVDCWLVTADYRTGIVRSRLWFAKESQILIREEQVGPDGSRMVKTLLPPEAAYGAATA